MRAIFVQLHGNVGIGEVVGELRRIAVQLLGHATGIDAGAPQVGVLGHSHPRAENASLAPSGDTAGYVGPTEYVGKSYPST